MDQKTINRRNRTRGKSFERRVAEKLGNWFRIPYSGSSELWGLGDVRDKDYRQVVTAVADGAIAGIAVRKYLSTK